MDIEVIKHWTVTSMLTRTDSTLGYYRSALKSSPSSDAPPCLTPDQIEHTFFF